MTAAKVMDAIARLPNCDGQAAGAVSAYNQVKSEDGPRLLWIPKSGCPCIYIYIYIFNLFIYGNVFHDINGPNRGPTLKIQWFLLKEICTDIHLQTSFGKDSSRKFCWNLEWETVTWEYRHRKQGLFLSVHVDDIKMAREREAKYGSHVEEIDEKCWSWRTNIIPWPRVFGSCTRKRKNVPITNFCRSNWKRFQSGRNCKQQLSRGPTTWKATRKSALRDVVNWQTKRRNNCTKFQRFACMTITSRRRSWRRSENCPMYAPKLLWNACTWHELVDLTFFGQWTNFFDLSQNGPEHVTNAWLVRFITFITQMTTDNIVMWESRLNIVDWVYSRTQILVDFEDSISTSERILCIFGSQTFVSSS